MANFLSPISPIMGAAETVSAVTLTNTVQPGTYWGDNSGNLYVYVYNAGNQQISQSQFAVLATGVSGYSVTVSSTTFVDVPIGIAKNATFATAAYGWLMYRGFSGFSSDTATNSAVVSGQVLLAGSNGNVQGATAAAGSFVTGTIIGKVLTSSATGVTFSNNAFFNFA